MVRDESLRSDLVLHSLVFVFDLLDFKDRDVLLEAGRWDGRCLCLFVCFMCVCVR